MKTALGMLAVLALMTAVATAIPQAPNVPGTVDAWLAGEQGPGSAVAAALHAIGAFDVYGSPAFLALLLALFLSLTACLIPRIKAWVILVRRSRPPIMRELPHDAVRIHTRQDAATTANVLRDLLGTRRWRLRVDQSGQPTPADVASRVAGDTGVSIEARSDALVVNLAGEKGLWSREGGSILFHLSFYVLLAAIVFGQLLTFEGQRGVIEGEPGFADTEVSYWAYRPGRWFSGADHAGWQLDLDAFHIDWIRDPHAPGAGQPTKFRSDVTITMPDGDMFVADVEGNRPLVIDGVKIHQLDWGYAPWVEIEVDGDLVYASFITTVASDDGAFRGAAKAPAATPDVGLELELFPFSPDGDDGLPRLTGAPWDDAPLLIFHQWRGDLQLGRTQQLITELDTNLLEPEGFGFMRPGDEVELNGVVVRFTELRRWVGFQVSYRPQIPWLLFGSALLIAGLVTALYAYRRRVWMRVESDPSTGRTIVSVYGRAFQRPEKFEVDFGALIDEMCQTVDGVRSDSAAGITAAERAKEGAS
ncbi:MAG: cytochrome c biogenesis protein ResB [Nitriliruptoraceae bacterium]